MFTTTVPSPTTRSAPSQRRSAGPPAAPVPASALPGAGRRSRKGASVQPATSGSPASSRSGTSVAPPTERPDEAYPGPAGGGSTGLPAASADGRPDEPLEGAPGTAPDAMPDRGPQGTPGGLAIGLSAGMAVASALVGACVAELRRAGWMLDHVAALDLGPLLPGQAAGVQAVRRATDRWAIRYGDWTLTAGGAFWCLPVGTPLPDWPLPEAIRRARAVQANARSARQQVFGQAAS